MNIDEEQFEDHDQLLHYGTPRHSGRYPWGSGGNEEHSPRNPHFLDNVKAMQKQGMSEAEIARGMGISTTQLRARKSIAKNEKKLEEITTAQRLHDKGMSNGAIAKQMGKPGESSVRALLESGAKDKADVLISTANMLKDQVDKHKIVDVGTGVETFVGPSGISQVKLNTAVTILTEQGYALHNVPVPQLGTGHDTQTKVLTPPGTTQKQAWEQRYNIHHISAFTPDGGRHYGQIHEPLSVHPDRVQVNFKEDGGDKADGVIYVREGVSDVSLGKARYAQVRVKVGTDHFLKGMAMYKDNLPPGVDLVFNTNKSKADTTKLGAMKKLEADPELPFGSVVYQILADHDTPKERVTSAMNIVNEEGVWGEWSKNISAQVLSKQAPSLAKAQLAITYDRRKKEFDELTALTNPTVKKKLLEKFAEGTDSAAVDLKAAELPRQASQVILPLETMPKTKIYAPNYKNGENVVLIRFPHGGTFEIPELTVDNRHPEGRALLGDAKDAVGINHAVAQRLSGADFDGDTVLVIPNSGAKIKHTAALEELKKFDPMMYKIPKDSKGDPVIPVITDERKQQLMGDVSNLITDMTIRQAPIEHIARAVKHSMVVIDAVKHELNVKQSALDNNIPALKTEYQFGAKKGASTLISRKKSTEPRDEMKPRPQSQGGPVDPVTGARVFVPTGKTRINKDGIRETKQRRYNKLDLATDAHTLSSGTIIEGVYAEHSNKLKALANQARLAALNTPRLKRNPSATKVYASEVASLEAKLQLVIKNRPLERQAQVIANAEVAARRAANPNLDKSQIKKIKFKAMEKARIRTGAKRRDIKITDAEWNAIQAGAISDNKLGQILNKADLKQVRQHATPRKNSKVTSAMNFRARQLVAAGNYTMAEIAEQLGVSTTTLRRALKDEEGAQ